MQNTTQPTVILFVCSELSSEEVESLKPTADTLVYDDWIGGPLVLLDHGPERGTVGDFLIRQRLRKLSSTHALDHSNLDEPMFFEFILIGHTGCKCARVSGNITMDHLSQDVQASVLELLLAQASSEITRIGESHGDEVSETPIAVLVNDVHILSPQPA